MGTLGRLVFGLSEREVLFSQRGFERDESGVYRRLERVGRAFLSGYHASLEEPSLARLVDRLDSIEPERRGFTYEGAAMGLTLFDVLKPWRASRLRALVDGPGAVHTYLIHVGVGWAMARLPRPLHRAVPAIDPLLGWLAFDGWGFHEAFFAPERTVRRHQRPRGLGSYARRAFDQGVGRCLWFVEAARVARIADTIAGFGAERGNDLWSGVGLAAAYAGGVDDAALRQLRQASGEHLPALAQGVAFAAKARALADGRTESLERAARIVCDLWIDEAAQVTDDALVDLALEARFQPNADAPAFETWRQRIQRRFDAAALPFPHAPHEGASAKAPLQRNTA